MSWLLVWIICNALLKKLYIHLFKDTSKEGQQVCYKYNFH